MKGTVARVRTAIFRNQRSRRKGTAIRKGPQARSLANWNGSDALASAETDV
jgi:hypothetical protein